MDFDHKKVLIIGTGLSGIAAARLLHKVNAEVILYDGNESLTEEAVREKLPEGIKADIIIGKFPAERTETIDLVILSPGVPTDLDYINNIREEGIPIWGEVELAYHFSKGKIAAITGTNGKTTTTALVGEILKAYYKEVFVVGNIGTPYTDMASDMTSESVTVAEMSSFQLETIHEFKPRVCALLNVSPDHLDRHHTMENYIQAKLNITKNQGAEDTCVLNYEDEVLREAGRKLQSKVVYFSSQRRLQQGIYLEEDLIILAEMEKKTVVCNIHELKILGRHNYENVMAGIVIGLEMGVPLPYIQEAIRSFQAVEHRIEYVDTIDGVKYYNDSKGTNPDAAIKAIEAMITPTLLIGGGYDKDSEYDEWIRAFQGKVRHFILLGQTREKIADAARRNGFHDIIMAESLEEAVQICADKAVAGESVLLSPACASWGMFKNYEERGNKFKEYVRKLN